MSLGRLLTSGKSLVGLHDPDSRYQMRAKNLLPKFGSDKNPFTRVKPESLEPALVEKIPTITRTMTPPEIAAARLKDTKRLPAVTAIKTNDVSSSSFKMNAVDSMNRIMKKLNPLAWWRARKSKAVKASPQPFAKAPVQAELSLDKIKVIRNDLSEGDLEVVPVKISVKAKTEILVQPEVQVEETAELIKT